MFNSRYTLTNILQNIVYRFIYIYIYIYIPSFILDGCKCNICMVIKAINNSKAIQCRIMNSEF